eukprot:gene16451-biopygen16579
MVGTRDSCQPMPVLMMLAMPGWAIASASASISSIELPRATRSSMDSLYITMKSSPTAFLTAFTISNGNCIRCGYGPPHLSVRLLVCSARNSLMRYPSEPMTSTPSNPASFASAAQCAKWRMVRSTPHWGRGHAFAHQGVMGDFVELGWTAIGLYAYRPACRICMQIFPPSSCTASVTSRYGTASDVFVIFPANTCTRPAMSGETPPVTISPTPPFARAPKNFAIFV